jgi:hypothetical protein
MQKYLNLPLKILIGQLLFFTISLLDDLLLLALAQWGLHHPWLHMVWLRHLAPILLACTVLYSLWQLRHFRLQPQQETWGGNSIL